MPYTTTLQPESTDSTQLSLHKIAQLLFAQVGNRNLTYLPEGSIPLSTDTEERLLQKINAMFVL